MHRHRRDHKPPISVQARVVVYPAGVQHAEAEPGVGEQTIHRSFQCTWARISPPPAGDIVARASSLPGGLARQPQGTGVAIGLPLSTIQVEITTLSPLSADAML